mmetsp:Transcript_1671/g.2232  ORF Transcript_1671/g.2232 Transcript_1671/m.2232 type:complete len:177 (+) Transcript_1671:1-531(+)
MSQIFQHLQPGDSLEFRQIPFNIKLQYPFDNPKTILMLAAGTGITPMYQALLRMFPKTNDHDNDNTGGNDPNINDDINVNVDKTSSSSTSSNTRVILLFGCHAEKDIYLRHELEDMQRRYPDRLRLYYAISEGREGRIDKSLLQMICREEELFAADVDVDVDAGDNSSCCFCFCCC